MLHLLASFCLLASCLQFIQADSRRGHEEWRYMSSEALSYVRRAKISIARKHGYRYNEEHVSGVYDVDELLNTGQAKAVWNNYNHRKRRAVMNFPKEPSYKWSIPIPYNIHPSVGDAGAFTIEQALAHFMKNTCIRFESKTTDDTHLFFKRDASCLTFIGKNTESKQQVVLLSEFCNKHMGEILHLLAHSVGLFHQHQRPDRDSYVRLISENIQDNEQDEFGQIPKDYVNTYGYPYDYTSITHFQGRMHSKNGKVTMKTRDEMYQNTIGQRVWLSFLDAKTINTAYCPDKCKMSSQTCLNGGYPDPNNCAICRCPDSYGGQLCEKLAPYVGKSCGGTLTATSSEMSITTPGYESGTPYNTGQSCTWLIQGESGKQVEVRFVDEFGVYCFAEACQHWVELHGYTDSTQHAGPRFCCSTLPSATIRSTTGQVIVAFRSGWIPDGSVGSMQRGFKLIYKTVGSQVDPPAALCRENPCRNNGTCTVVGDSYKCTCEPPFIGVNCSEVAAECGGCGLPGGYVQPPCPERMCNATVVKYRRECRYVRSWWFGRRRRSCDWIRYTSEESQPCLCCDNAHLEMHRREYRCVTLGLSNWTRCNFPCGGCGWQTRSKYVLVDWERSYWDHCYYGRSRSYTSSKRVSVVDTEYQACNFQKCTKSLFKDRCDYRWWWYGDNFDCCDDHILEGDICKPRK